MEIVFFQFGLAAMNLITAKLLESQKNNPWLSYFVAGMCFGFGLTKLIDLL